MSRIPSGRTTRVSNKPRGKRPRKQIGGRVDFDDAEWVLSFVGRDSTGAEVDRSDVVRWVVSRAREYYEASGRWGSRIDRLAAESGLTRSYLMARVIELGLAAYEELEHPRNKRAAPGSGHDRPKAGDGDED